MEAADCQKLCDSLKQKLIDAQQALANSQKHFQAVSSGLSGSSDGQAESLSAQKIGMLDPLLHVPYKLIYWRGINIGDYHQYKIRQFVSI